MLSRIRVVMLRSRSPGNVGSAARAMLNFGLTSLHAAELPEFDDPGFFERESRKMAWRAGAVLDGLRVHDRLDGALDGTSLVIGTAPRELRGTPTLTPREAATQLVDAARGGREVALVFGGEANGISKRELSRMAGLVRIPTGDAYEDLNLSQSVVICAYEIFLAAGAPRAAPPAPDPEDAPLPHAETQALVDAGQDLLARVGYLKEDGFALADELRRVMTRARLTRREANLVRGMIRRLNRAVKLAEERPPAARDPATAGRSGGPESGAR